jgi:hypothetical protein
VLPDKFTLTARSRVSNVVYYRQKATGVWGPWAIDGAADYVNVTGDTMTGALAISSTTPSTSSTTGALTVAGGVGVAHGITSGYDITATQTYSGFPNRGSIVFGNSGKYLHYSDSSNYFLLGGARLFVSDATASTSPTTGSLTLAGGAGIGGAIWCNAVNINNWTMPANSAALRIGSNNANGASIVTRPSADGGTAMQFENFNGGIVGSIGTSASNTSFNTSSDMRLKDDLKSFDAGNIVDDTNVYDFAWKSTGERSYGVIAQQAQEVYPAAVTYEQKQDWWGIDYSKYVPVILQELKALRARVAELEGRTDTKPPPS